MEEIDISQEQWQLLRWLVSCWKYNRHPFILFHSRASTKMMVAMHTGGGGSIDAYESDVRDLESAGLVRGLDRISSAPTERTFSLTPLGEDVGMMPRPPIPKRRWPKLTMRDLQVLQDLIDVSRASGAPGAVTIANAGNRLASIERGEDNECYSVNLASLAALETWGYIVQTYTGNPPSSGPRGYIAITAEGMKAVKAPERPINIEAVNNIQNSGSNPTFVLGDKNQVHTVNFSINAGDREALVNELRRLGLTSEALSSLEQAIDADAADAGHYHWGDRVSSWMEAISTGAAGNALGAAILEHGGQAISVINAITEVLVNFFGM
jgi:hypothetical protein